MPVADILEAPDEALTGKDPQSTQDIVRVNQKQLKQQQSKADPLTDWVKEPPLTELQKDLNGATMFRNSNVADVDRWTLLREGGKKLPKRRGRSTVRPKLVRRNAEWRYSSLSEPFLSSDKIFDIKPRTFEDAKAAAQNELLLNWQFMTKMDIVKFVDESVRTLVDEGTLILRTGWDRQYKTEQVVVPVYTYSQVYEGTQQEQMLSQALQVKQENPRAFLDLPPEIQKSVEWSMENGRTGWATKTGEQTVNKKKVVKNQPTVDIVDYRNFFIDPSCKGDPEKANFMVMSFETSKAELIKDGRYKRLKQVNWASADILSQPDHATEIPDGFNFADDLRKRIVAYEYWGMADINNDGVLVPIVATWVENQLIRMEKNPYPDQKPPFEFISYLPKKRSVFGEPDAELLEDNQTIVGAVTRGMIDLMGRSSNAQQGIAKGLLDTTNRRRWASGEDYEYNPTGNPDSNIITHKFPEIPSSAINVLNMQNQEAEGLSGVRAFSGGMSGEAYGKVAAGIKGSMDAAAKREMNILRRIANGFKRIGARVMSMNAVFLSEEEIVRVTNELFVPIRREDIQGEFDLIVDISTPEVDEQKSQDLSMMLQTLGPSAPLPFTQMILAKIAKLKRMPELAHQIENFKPEPDPVEEMMKKIELKKLELELGKIQSEINKNNAHAEKLQADADQTDLETELNAGGVSHARDMEKQSEQARGNQDLAVTKAITAPVKEGEKRASLEEAVGFNELTKSLSSASNRPFSVLPPEPAIDGSGFPLQ